VTLEGLWIHACSSPSALSTVAALVAANFVTLDSGSDFAEVLNTSTALSAFASCIVTLAYFAPPGRHTYRLAAA
jgi:hypothetical protein